MLLETRAVSLGRAQADSLYLRQDQNLADIDNVILARAALGLGSAAEVSSGDFATAAQGAKADTALQAAAIGVSVQAYDAGLSAITAFGYSLIDDADAAAGRATLAAAGTGVANTFSQPQLFSATGVIALAGTAHALQAGVSSSGNLAISTNAIQARSNGAAAELRINLLGGAVGIRGAVSGLAAGLHVPWVSGDTLSAAFFGSLSATINPVQIAAGAAIALNAYNTSTTTAAIEMQNTTSSTNARAIGLAISHNSSATPLAGFGTQLRFRLKSSTTTNQLAGNLQYLWIDPTHASRKARGMWTVYDTAEREAIRIEASGTAAMIGFYTTAAVGRQTITGSRGGNAALADLLTKLALTGLIVDESSA